MIEVRRIDVGGVMGVVMSGVMSVVMGVVMSGVMRCFDEIAYAVRV